MFFSEIKKLFSEIKNLYFPKTSIFERFSEIKKLLFFISKYFQKYLQNIFQKYFQTIFKLFSEIFSKNILNFAKTSKNGCFTQKPNPLLLNPLLLNPNLQKSRGWDPENIIKFDHPYQSLPK